MTTLKRNKSVAKYCLKFGRRMSRLAKQPIAIPVGATATLDKGTFSVKGPKGELTRVFKTGDVNMKIEDNAVVVTARTMDNVFVRSLLGTYASHVRNMIEGVTKGYEKKLILEGVGYKSAVTGNSLDLALGFSHPVKIEIPAGLTVTADKNIVTITGADKESVGSFAAYIRSLKKPEPYKGKGFRYDNEIIRRKQGKKSV